MAADAQSRTRVLIADDHPVYLDGLAGAIERAEDFELVAACRAGDEALRRIHADAPDVAVLDLRMPFMTARGILEALSAVDHACAVLVLSAYADGGEVHECLSLGAAGYLAKDADRRAICAAIRSVAHGRTVLSSEVQSSVSEELRRRRLERQAVLSPRETEVLCRLADGATAAEIAGALYLTTATVKTHLHRLYEKLGVSDRAAAVAEGMRRGLIR
jgi:two-component system, NarL family, nitrate/nitrite response regulator NarL